MAKKTATATATAPASSSRLNGLRTTFRPLGDKILVQRDEPESRTESGIFLPESGKEKPKTGRVIAVGDGSLNTETGERIPLTVKQGDRVIFASYAGTEIKLEGEEMLILSESEVLAVID